MFLFSHLKFIFPFGSLIVSQRLRVQKDVLGLANKDFFFSCWRPIHGGSSKANNVEPHSLFGIHGRTPPVCLFIVGEAFSSMVAAVGFRKTAQNVLVPGSDIVLLNFVESTITPGLYSFAQPSTVKDPRSCHSY